MDEKDFELAAKIAEADIERALARATKKDPAPPGWSGSDCSECGEPVPKPRLQHGFHTCIECQTRREQIERLRR